MKKLVGLALLTTIFLYACAPKTVTESPISAPVTVTAPKAPWEETWEKVVNEGRKEGSVVIISALGSEVATTMNQAFSKKYGVAIEFNSGRGAEIAQKIITQRRAGLHVTDIFMGGATSGINTLKPAGAFDPLERAFILPEVVDPKNWLNEKLTFVDRDRTIFPYVYYAVPPLGINTDLVKPEDVKSHRDLLSPRWKGKIVMQDPTTPGTAGSWFASVHKVLGLDFMRELAKQEPMITRDQRLQWEWIAQGKYPVGISPSSNLKSTFIKAGAHVQLLAIDGTFTSGGSSNIAMLNQAPHPNATRLFINWFLGREGQTIMSKASLLPSARVDVPTDHVIPETIPKPGYVDAGGEDFLLDLPNQMEIAREIFGHLTR